MRNEQEVVETPEFSLHQVQEDQEGQPKGQPLEMDLETEPIMASPPRVSLNNSKDGVL